MPTFSGSMRPGAPMDQVPAGACAARDGRGRATGKSFSGVPRRNLIRRRHRGTSVALTNDPEPRLARQLRHRLTDRVMLELVDAAVERLADHRLIADHLQSRPGRALAFEHEALDRLEARIARHVDVAPEADFRIDVDVAAVVL